MILDLENPTSQDRYVPDVIGYNFSVLMPDPYAPTKVRNAPKPRLAGLGQTDCRLTAGQATIENLTTGNLSSFKVGDRYRITLHGCVPGAPVYLNAQFREMPMPMSGQQDLALSAWLGYFSKGLDALGTLDSAGNWSATGTFTGAQAGRWHQVWNMGGQLSPALDFDVYAADGSLPGPLPNAVPGGSPYYLLASNQAPSQSYTAEQLTAMSKPNQSVPPNSPLTTIPTLPSATPTKQMLTSAYTSGSGAVQVSAGSLFGLDTKTLLLAAAGIGVLAMVVKR